MRRLRAGWFVGTLVVPLVFCVAVPGSSAGNPPSSAAASVPHSSKISVVVTLRDRPELSRIRAPDRPLGSRVVESRLRSHARSSQRPLLARLTDWRGQGSVSSVRSLWISNSVAVTATPDVVRRIAARADVASVRLDAIVLTPAANPTPNQTAIGSPTVWAAGQTGQGVVVATLDSGVDPTDPDLAASWRGGSNSWFDPYAQRATPFDATGHGTGVLGVMVGGEDTGSAVGTAPGASWISARVFNNAGGSTISGIHAAFQWLLNPDGNPATDDAPRVVNASWAIGTAPSCDLVFQPDVAALRLAGILPVFPAGNFGSSASSSISPANYPESLSVGAVNGSDVILSASGRGPSTCGGRTRVFPDLVAPGSGILTLDRYGFTQTLTGTSIAAPHAAGTLALLLGARPGLTPQQQSDLLTSTAVDLGAAGADSTYGAGRLNAADAYAALPALQPDFALSATPPSVTVTAGAATIYDVHVSPVDGFSGDVALAVTGLPSGQGSATVAPSTVTGASGDATISVTTDAAASGGTFPLTVTGTSGALTHGVQVTLEIQPVVPPADLLVFSTVGNTSLPGLADGDDADLYGFDGSVFERRFDASMAGLGGRADVDGLDLVAADGSHFFASFERSVWLPGLGWVRDEDVVEFADGAWSMFFDGSRHGLNAGGADLDALSVRGDNLFFSTRGDAKVPGVGAVPDDADVYKWNGSRFSRVWRATRKGVPRSADVDGLSWTGPSQQSLSFATATVRVAGLGVVRDEDVVTRSGGAWSVTFDGSAHGLGGTGGLDVDAFDLP